MKISVALCTYNGEKYLEEQLESLAAQSLPPDELVVGDDASCDDTSSLLSRFASRAPFPVHLHSNPNNLGSTANFAQTVARCQGDIIALCDQDDWWHPHKLQRMAAAFSASTKIGLVFSDAELVDATRLPLGRRLWTAMRFTLHEQARMRAGAFAYLHKRNMLTGATMAYRASLNQLALPIPIGPVIHDGWIALVATAVSEAAWIEEPLIEYRQHEAQQSGGMAARPQRMMSRRHYVAQIAQLEMLHQRLSAPELHLCPDAQDLVPLLPAQIEHVRARMNLPRSKPSRAPLVARELWNGNYHRFSNGWRSAAGDLLV